MVIDRIYGSIFCYAGTVNSNPNFTSIISKNMLALEALPIVDSFPPLTRNLFSITSCRYRVAGFNQEQVIHFGGSFKDIAQAWDTWLGKFEGLLKIIYWSEARVNGHK